MFSIRIVGAGGRGEWHVWGEQKGAENVALMAGGVQGIYDAPTISEWTRARRQRGGRFKGIEQSERDVVLTLGVRGSGGSALAEHESAVDTDSQIRQAFTYQLDRWDTSDELAKIVAAEDGDERWLHVQMGQEPEFNPETLKSDATFLKTSFRLKVAQPMWEAKPWMSAWETSSSGTRSGSVTVHNPTDQPMFQTWILTPGTWTLPDPIWQGRPRNRTVKTMRTVPLNQVTYAHGGLRVSLDQMKRMFTNLAGTNVAGDVAAGYWFLNEVPPYTPKTTLPLSVVAPTGGARAELHQPRLWSRPWGLR